MADLKNIGEMFTSLQSANGALSGLTEENKQVILAELEKVKGFIPGGVTAAEYAEMQKSREAINTALSTLPDGADKNNVVGAFGAFFDIADPSKDLNEKKEIAEANQANPIMSLLVNFLAAMGFIDDATAKEWLGTATTPTSTPSTGAPGATTEVTSTDIADYKTSEQANDARIDAEKKIAGLKKDREVAEKELNGEPDGAKAKFNKAKEDVVTKLAPAASVTAPTPDSIIELRTANDKNIANFNKDSATFQWARAAQRYNTGNFTDDPTPVKDSLGKKEYSLHLNDDSSFWGYDAGGYNSLQSKDAEKAVGVKEEALKNTQKAYDEAIGKFGDDSIVVGKEKAKADFKDQIDTKDLIDTYAKDPAKFAQDKADVKAELEKMSNATGTGTQQVLKDKVLADKKEMDALRAEKAEHEGHKKLAEGLLDGTYGGTETWTITSSALLRDSQEIVDDKNARIKEIDKKLTELEGREKANLTKLQEESIKLGELQQKQENLNSLDPVMKEQAKVKAAEDKLAGIDKQIASLTELVAKLSAIFDKLVDKEQKAEAAAKQAALDKEEANARAAIGGEPEKEGKGKESKGNDKGYGEEERTSERAKPKLDPLAEERIGLETKLKDQQRLLNERETELLELERGRRELVAERDSHKTHNKRYYGGNLRATVDGNEAAKQGASNARFELAAFDRTNADRVEELKREIGELKLGIGETKGRIEDIKKREADKPLNKAESEIEAVDGRLNNPVTQLRDAEAKLKRAQIALDTYGPGGSIDREQAVRDAEAKVASLRDKIEGLRDERTGREGNLKETQISEQAKTSIKEKEQEIKGLDEKLKMIDSVKGDLGTVATIVAEAQSTLAAIQQDGANAKDEFRRAGGGAAATVDEAEIAKIRDALGGFVKTAKEAGATGTAEKFEDVKSVLDDALKVRSGEKAPVVTVEEMKDIQAALRSSGVNMSQAQLEASLAKDKEAIGEKQGSLKEDIQKLRKDVIGIKEQEIDQSAPVRMQPQPLIVDNGKGNDKGGRTV